ncbi:hypothetical protein CXB51_013585 [Gossypium anomalum]|uniref:Isopenicillin N synthase-like Fe(2+) 2OG dioxygenase domain-containing protein n=1 Tax=Gossypium anomalum TaxID=47600 RepID=A0A8J5Z6Y2_9ROSI|nr:hypothetical protein CXB51_013585 [Gossypium anomalum]
MSRKMSSDSHFGIPIIELPTNSKDLDGGSDEWRSLCNKISSYFQHESFSLIRQLFNLPLETKKQNVKSKPLHGYYEPGDDFLPFYESFGLEDASNCNSSKASPNLCRSIAIITSEKREWLMKDYQLRRVMEYSAPPSGEYTNVVSAHTDKLCSALLCEDGISGLEVETKDGEWVKLCMPPGTFAFIVGDLLNVADSFFF